MNPALSNQSFFTLNRGRHLSEIFRLPQNVGSVYISTHFEIGDSDLLHYHDEPHLTFILNGGILDKRKTLDAERFAGELLFFHAGEPHQTITTVFPTKYVSLQFQTDYFQQNPSLESSLKSSIEQTPDAKLSMLRIYKELAINDEFSNSSIEMLLLNLLESKIAAKKTCPNWLNKIIELLNDKWNDEISVNDLALAANVHPKTVSKYFPKYFACTLGEYRRQLKVEKSLSLIKSSNLSLTEIAYQCGFYDQSHFTATFKQLTGFLPKQFQKF